MRPAHPGYVQTLFERREGRTLESWLTERGPAMTATQAAKLAGYADSSAISTFARRHMPEGFAFRRVTALFSTAEIIAAIDRNEAGEAWRTIALEYRRDVGQLKGVCRCYRRQVRDAANV